MEELKERHQLAPERNTLDYTKFMIKYQIEYLREEVADRLILQHNQEELLQQESLKMSEQQRNEKFHKLR